MNFQAEHDRNEFINKHLLWYAKKYTYFFHKQPVFKQLAIGWQIVKKLSGLNSFSTKQQYKLQIKEKWRFSFAINVK